MDLRATLSPTPENPTRLGRYTLYETIGEGGMARVFRADMEGVGGFRKAVALKVIRPHLLEEEGDFVPRFMDEARLGGSLSHPNIVTTLDFGEADGLLYIAMEYVDGPTLHDVLRISEAQGAPVPLGVALELIRQACAGLDAAHQGEDSKGQRLGVVHRDIKPSNLLLSKRGHLKVADFGIARAQGNEFYTLQTGVIRGTLRYLSPEQAWGKRDVDHRSDLFSLCAVLYELLTLRPLFSGDSVTLLVRQTQDCAFGDALNHLPKGEAYAPLRGLLERGLQQDPGLRFQSGRGLLDAIDAILDTLPRVRMEQWLQALEAGAPGALTKRLPPGGGSEDTSRALPPLEATLSPKEGDDDPAAWGGNVYGDVSGPPEDGEASGDLNPRAPQGSASKGSSLGAMPLEMDAYPIVGPPTDEGEASEPAPRGPEAGVALGEEGGPEDDDEAVWGHPILIGLGVLLLVGCVAGGLVMTQDFGTSVTEIDRARKARKAAMATPTPTPRPVVKEEVAVAAGAGRRRLRAPLGPGLLTVKCSEACTVRVDGRVLGAAPVRNHRVEGGPHTVKVSWLEGYSVETEFVMLKGGRWKCVGDMKTPAIVCESL